MAPLLVALLAAAPVELSIGITPFQLIQMPEQMAGYAEDRLAIQLGQRGFKVTTPADMRALLGLERQKQLLGCAESDCIAEIAGALGVAALLVGDLGMVGGARHHHAAGRVLEERRGARDLRRDQRERE